MRERTIHFPFKIKRGRSMFSMLGPREVILLAIAAIQALWWCFAANVGLDLIGRGIVGASIGLLIAAIAIIPIRGYKAEVFAGKFLRWWLGPKEYIHQTALRTRPRESETRTAPRAPVAPPKTEGAPARRSARRRLALPRLGMGIALASVVDALMAVFLLLVCAAAIALHLARGGLSGWMSF